MTYTEAAESAFERQFQSFELPSADYSILLGLSGGADSVTLLFLLDKYKKKYGFSLYALHVNHMIRGNEADRDEEFCKKLCDSLDIPLFVIRADIPAIAKESKIGIEEAARNVRYAEFEKHSHKLLPCVIATAHNADDNAETILFNLTRGTSLVGLAGIKKQRDNIIRPILTLTKDEILGYCRENCIEYITDSTNSDNCYTRNRIRNLVIPELKALNPSLCRTVGRMADNFYDINDYINQKAYEFTASYPNGVIDINKFNIEHIAIKKAILCQLIKSSAGFIPEDVHLNAIISLCDNRVINSSLDIGRGYRAVIRSSGLQFEHAINDKFENFDIILNFGTNHIPNGVIGLFFKNEASKITEFQNIYKKSIQTLIKSDKINGVLRARSRAAGDVYNINGVNRKLKKVLNEIEPDLKRRNSLPVIYDDKGIIWVPGARSATGTYPSQNDTAAVIIYSYFID